MSDSALDGPRLSDTEFKHLAALVESRAGIRMPAGKRTMLEGRPRRRLPLWPLRFRPWPLSPTGCWRASIARRLSPS